MLHRWHRAELTPTHFKPTQNVFQHVMQKENIMSFVKEPGQPLKWKSKFPSYNGGKQPGGNNDNEKSTPQEVNKTITTHDYQNNKHTVEAHHVDGRVSNTEHGTGAEARARAEQYEVGGEDANTDVKKREHFPEQGAQSEDDTFIMPDLI